MTERPGRRALFTGATIPSHEEKEKKPDRSVALVEGIAQALKAAAEGSRVPPLLPQAYGEPYFPALQVINDALQRLAAHRRIEASAKMDERYAQCEQEIAGFQRTIEQIRKEQAEEIEREKAVRLQEIGEMKSQSASELQRIRQEKDSRIETLEKTLAEEAGLLARSFTALVLQSPFPMLLIRRDQTIAQANPAYLEMAGVPREQVVGKNFHLFRVVSRSGDSFTDAVSGALSASCEITIDFPSGEKTLRGACIPLQPPLSGPADVLVAYTDITAGIGTVTEERRRKGETERLRHCAEAVIRQNPMPIMMVDTSFAIRLVNDAYMQLTGIDRSRLLAMNARDFRILSQSGEGLKQVIAQKKRSVGEVTVEFPTGIRRLQQFGIPVDDATGQLSDIIVIYNDITEERKKMEEITELHRVADTIVQQNPIPILMTDPQFTVAEANTAYLQMSGMDKKSVIGMSLRSVKVLEQKGEGAKVAIQGKKRSFGEVTVELPSGIHTLEQFTIPLLDAGGGIANLLFVYNDVTSQRRHQQELTEKMAQIATLKQRSDIIVRQNPMPILLLDPAFKIILVNDAYIALTGIKKETLLAMNARDFAIMEQKGEGLKKVITDRKRSFGEVRLQFPSGIKVLEQYGIPIVDAEGKLSTILAVYNDVTRQREQEAEIKRMMEEAKAEAELLSMSVSELRTAMASVASGDMTYLLSIDEADPLAPIKNDYNMAMGAIRTVMEEIVQSVIKIHSTVKETLQSNEEIAKATEQVAVSSQKSTDEAKSQLSSMERIAKDISEISASIEEIASTSQEVTGHARKASQMGADAAKIGTVATEKMQIFERISQESLDNITALNDQMRQISKIVNLITDIANQTNLLALNAAIEAARAAEHGRGFAVVAGEVKNLAAESKRASAQIEDLIKGIQAKSAVTAESMSNSFTEIKAGIESVNSTVAALSQIIAEANVVSAGITEITRATGDQAKAANQLMQGIESSAGLTRGNRKRMEDLAALAQETSASTEEIASASSELVRMADRTKDLMQKFRLN